MLFTRCPDCDTTFRITDETLKRANGQVRCGRCASVFNAYAELHDPNAKVLEPAPKPPARRPSTPAESPLRDAASTSTDTTSATAAPTELETAAAEETEPEAETTPPESGPITPKEVERVLAAGVDVPTADLTATWPRLPIDGQAARTNRAFGVAAALAVLVFGAQLLHHFRTDIAGNATFGPWITRAYAAVGVEVRPEWDVHQYEILDWVASAEPNARGLGSLKITARIQNRGPQRQPYPDVQLRLKDRWEDAVGSRTFVPAEYLPRDVPRGRLMAPGETTRAEIEVVDPGPDAYGFELDVCIEGEASSLSCGTDEVFL